MSTILLDTHSVLWAALDPPRLGPGARAALKRETLLLSAASLWEIAILSSLKRISLALTVQEFAAACRKNLGVEILPIEANHLDALKALPFHHRDPFDRLIVAQAKCLAVPIVSKDGALDAYGIERIWIQALNR